MNLVNEQWLYFRRDPTPGLRFIRVSRWGGDTIPHGKSLVNREVLGWTLDSQGRCSRILSVIVRGEGYEDDGCYEWRPCPMYPDTPISPEGIRAKLYGQPPREQHSSPDVAAIERAHRQPFMDHWAAYAANEAALAKARAEQQAKAEAEAAARAEQERLAIRAARLPPKPKTFWQKLTGK
jgi:hypothetical protein